MYVPHHIIDAINKNRPQSIVLLNKNNYINKIVEEQLFFFHYLLDQNNIFSCTV